MKRILCLASVILLGGATPTWAVNPFACLNHGIHCICPPPPPCPDCDCPCDHGLHFCSCRRTEHAHKLIDELNCSGCCCDRIKAAEKLGCRLHADFCCDPEVLSALSHALLCDPCWEVRQAAAWSIAGQKARTNLGVLSLYLSSKIDPHYMVRDAATDALTQLLVCRRDCFKDTFAQGDAMAKSLKGKYKPGVQDCIHLLDDCLAGCGMAPTAPAPAPAPAPLPPAGKATQLSAPKLPGAITLQRDELQPAPVEVTPR
jgi:hypothetical protein